MSYELISWVIVLFLLVVALAGMACDIYDHTH